MKLETPLHQPAQQAFVKIIDQFEYGLNRRDVFKDFVHMAQISLYQGVHKAVTGEIHQEREAEYMRLIRRYKPADQKRMGELFAQVALGIEQSRGDFLGEIYEALGVGNPHIGQYFTPESVSRLMSEINLDGAGDAIAQRGFATVCDPACGAGVMLIEFASAMQRAGHNPQRQLHVTAIDLDYTAAAMCYVQLTLLHIPALVYHGNSLSNEIFAAWPTLAHVMGGWDYRLKQHVPETPEPNPAQSSPPPQSPPAEIQTAKKRGKFSQMFFDGL